MLENSEFFVTTQGSVIMDTVYSEKLFTIKERKPETFVKGDTGYEWNEMGMAALFGLLYQNEARYCPEHKSWYTYHDGAWRRDEGDILVSERLKDFARLMLIYCGEISDDELRKTYTTFIAKMGDRRFRDRILRDAMGELRISARDFDSDPYLINCLNGTYNLKDLTFREHSYSDFITKQTSFCHTVDKQVKSERWEQFIAEVTQNDKDKADFLQRSLGYSLLGIANEECMFILHGKTTRNGKSTLLNTLEVMLGDYAKVAPVGMICKGDRAKDADAASPTLARLKGTRFVTMAESNEYGKLDEEKIKQLTGGEEITARELYQKPTSFLPQFTLWLSCNDLPIVTDKSLFASKRIKVIEFNRHFSSEEQDTKLKNELTKQSSMSGIFNWLIRGYVRYVSKGLSMADTLEEVVTKYEKDNDVIQQFLEAKCDTDETESVTSTVLYGTYKLWARAGGMYPVSIRKFVSEMERHSDWFKSKEHKNGSVIYKGLKQKEAI